MTPFKLVMFFVKFKSTFYLKKAGMYSLEKKIQQTALQKYLSWGSWKISVYMAFPKRKKIATS